MWQELLASSLPWEGRRLRLRRIKPSDARLHVRLSNDLEVRRFLGSTLNLTEEEARAGLTRQIAARSSMYVIELLGSDDSLGYCGFTPNRHIPETDLLVSLLPEYQARGYGSEVLGMLKSAWLERLGNEECFATVLPENAKAISILRHHGFKRVREYVDFFEEVHHVYKTVR